MHFVHQAEPLGHGHAVYCAHEFVGDDPFLHLVGDHLYVSREQRKLCRSNLSPSPQAEQCAVSAVQATRETLLPYYGAIGGRRVQGQPGLYEVETVIEKPTPTVAEQQLIVSGLRAGHYLCFFGMHVLTKTVMELLGELIDGRRRRQRAGRVNVTLSDALALLPQRERYLAMEQHYSRYDVGVKYGLLNAQLALALNGSDREQVLTMLLELLAQRELMAQGRVTRHHERTRSRIITSADPAVRNRSLDALAAPPAHSTQLLAECAALDEFRRQSDNLYERVRALFFLYALYRFHLPAKAGPAEPRASFPLTATPACSSAALKRPSTSFWPRPSPMPPPARWPTAYHQLAFQTLANQVRRSVRSVRGNQWMFRLGHPDDQPLRVPPGALCRDRSGLETALFPILHEATPVRMDLTHSGWSDIFFLGMDFPEGARVLNISIDLAVRGQTDDATAAAPKPPIETFFRVIDRPVLRLVSVDLGASVEITTLAEVFDFAKDYLGLLKAAVIAVGHRAAGHGGRASSPWPICWPG